MLEIKDLYASYGKLEILKGVNMKVKKGEIVALIGPNGAGKSTVLKSVFGIVPKRKGIVIFKGENIIKRKPNEIVSKGISFVPQGRIVFPSLTVLENLEMGAYIRKDDYSKDLEHVFSLFPILKERKKQKASLLSGGQQQMVALGRALMLNPELILLDEPSLGLDPKTMNLIFEKIKEINKQGTTLLIVEQNAHKVLQIADRGYVLDLGKERLEGKGKDLLKDKRVQKLYLGW